MADNVAITAGTGTTIAADDVGGILTQRVKVQWGPDGTVNDTDVATGKPLPVQHRVSDGTAWTYGSGAIGAGTPRVTLATDSPSAAPGLSVSVSVTRPSDTTAYAANDVLGPTGGGTSGIDFNLGAVSASNILITSVALERDVTAVISGETSYSLYLYNVTPPSALADNIAFDIPSGDRASFLGKINLGSPVDEGSTLYVEQNGVNKQVKLAGTHIFGYLVTVGAYTPASATVLKVTLNAVQLQCLPQL